MIVRVDPQPVAREDAMIDLLNEKPISLTAAAAMVPPARGGKRTHRSTILRWIVTGAKGPAGEVVRLEGTILGCRWFTSEEALQRFTDRLTPRFDTRERTGGNKGRRRIKAGSA
jgi:hypothetical protein